MLSRADASAVVTLSFLYSKQNIQQRCQEQQGGLKIDIKNTLLLFCPIEDLVLVCIHHVVYCTHSTAGRCHWKLATIPAVVLVGVAAGKQREQQIQLVEDNPGSLDGD